MEPNVSLKKTCVLVDCYYVLEDKRALTVTFTIKYSYLLPLLKYSFTYFIFLTSNKYMN